ncbi:MAG: hypothetical protein EHM93_14060 [Bacteroidales bacterium]|nr:MAG: hypothetical protein EHM93_14060 [Bacteroidales bacterium]
MNWLRVYPFLFIALLSCNQADDPKVQFLNWAQKGTITDNIKCKAEPNQSYCVYLPTSYDVSKSSPAIYAFDPQGKGRIPVALMKSIAERLGYIVIGSNNSKNGLSPEEINSIVNSLFADTQRKLAIDPNRVYLSGFSGGARVACMVAQAVNGIQGVIACSAGFQLDRNSLGFHFIGIAGTQDMNYLEMRRLNAYMDSVGIQNQLIVFKGKHHWPYEPTISEAITMLEIYSTQNSIANKSIVDEFLSSNIKRIHRLKGNNCPDSLALACFIAKRTYETLDGTVDANGLKSTIDSLSQMQSFQKYIKEQVLLEIFEYQKQHEFASAFGSKPETWWNSEIRKLNDGGVGLKGDVSIRLLGYISLRCYGNVNRAFFYKDWKAAQHFISIYRQVDPENPDSWYALACLQANTDKSIEAIESLKNAIKFGLADFSKIKNDPLLITLRGNPMFNAILNGWSEQGV